MASCARVHVYMVRVQMRAILLAYGFRDRTPCCWVNSCIPLFHESECVWRPFRLNPLEAFSSFANQRRMLGTMRIRYMCKMNVCNVCVCDVNT